MTTEELEKRVTKLEQDMDKQIKTDKLNFVLIAIIVLAYVFFR